jgi:hypothetical protein
MVADTLATVTLATLSSYTRPTANFVISTNYFHALVKQFQITKAYCADGEVALQLLSQSAATKQHL